MASFRIRKFEVSDQTAANQLILDGLREYWGALDPAYNHDLDDIRAAYPVGFYVGVIDGVVIATGGLTRVDDDTVRIERMSVKKAWRRHGFGKLMLERLIDHGRSMGAKAIILETTQNWKDARSFYEQNGFVFTHVDGDDAYYRIEI